MDKAANVNTLPQNIVALPYIIAKSINTGNFLFDSILSCIVIALVSSVVSKFDVMINSLWCMIAWLGKKSTYIWQRIYNYIGYVVVKRKMMQNKTCIISLITENKEVNELYYAIEWYLMSNTYVDYSKETPVNVSFPMKIDRMAEKDDIKLNYYVDYGKTKKIKFKKNEIQFTFSSEIMTIHMDKKREKENRKITLETQIECGEVDQHTVLADFCNHCVIEYRKFIKSKLWVPQVYVNRNGNWNGSKLENKRKIESIILRHNMQNNIKSDLERFQGNQDFYQELGIPYRRGYLFYGTPGTGKTSMIKAISNFTKRDIYYVNINDIRSDNELFDLMQKIPHERAIVVFEDIDCMTSVVKTREQPEKKTDEKAVGITLSGLFNIIDGVFDAYGRILIMTTNHPETLDPALVRPGRVDMRIEFGNCVTSQLSDMYKLYYKTECDAVKISKIEENKYSPAYISTLFMSYINEPDSVFNHIDDNIIISSCMNKLVK